MNNVKIISFFFITYLLLTILNLSIVTGITNQKLSLFVNYIGFLCLLTAFLLSKPFSSPAFSVFLFRRSLLLARFVFVFYLVGIVVAIFNNNYEPVIKTLPLIIRCSLSIFMITWLFSYLLSIGMFGSYVKIFAIIIFIATTTIVIFNSIGIELSYLIDTDLNAGDDMINRSTGFFINANIAAQYSNFAIIFLLYFFEARKLKIYSKIFLSGLIVICIYALILTFSTTGFINLLLIFSYLMFNRYKNKLKFFFHFIIILVLFEVIVISAQAYSWQYYEAFDITQVQQEKVNNFLNLVSLEKTEKINYSMRDELARKGFEKVMQRPFFGYGSGSFNAAIINGLGVHNTYLQIIGEDGVFIFVIYIFVILRILYRCVVIKDKAINFLISSSFLSIIVYQITTHGIMYTEEMLLMMIFINCVSPYGNYLEQSKSGMPRFFKSINLPIAKVY